MRSVIGETTLDIGPGAKIRIAAGSCPGMVVGVKVGPGVGAQRRLRCIRGRLLWSEGNRSLSSRNVRRACRQGNDRRQVFRRIQAWGRSRSRRRQRRTASQKSEKRSEQDQVSFHAIPIHWNKSSKSMIIDLLGLVRRKRLL